MTAALRRTTFFGLMAMLLAACSDAAGPARVESVEVTAPAQSIVAGQTMQLSVMVRDEDGDALPDRPVTFSSDNKAVATVSASGLVTAVAPGSATITAAAEDKTGRIMLTVTPAPVASVTVSPTSATVTVGSTQPLTATALDASGGALTGRAVTWLSSNTAIATVSAAGVVTGVAPGGPVTITATIEGRSASAQITVIPVPIATLTLSPNPAEVRVGLTTQLTVVARDAAGNELGGRTVMLVSSNAAVATIDANRMVTGLSAGTVTITATAEGRTATTTVNVVPGPVTSVEVTPQDATIQSGATVQLTAVARDASGAAVGGRAITWTSANPAIASVSATGLVTGGNPGGPVVITATVEGKSAQAQITVIPVPIATLTLSPNPAEVRVGLTTQLTVVARDAAGNELGGRTVTLVSSNPAVATIDGNRVVTGVSAGSATITATAEGKTATATINVVPGPVATVTVTPQDPQVREGATLQLTATTRDASGAVVTGRSVTWTSSNTSVATVSATGVVTGAAPGTATITATSEGRSGSTTVTVLRAQVTSIRFAPVQFPFIVGDTVRIRAVAVDSLGRELPDRAITFSGSNNAVATVSSSGLASGVSAGDVTVTATSEGVSNTQVATVRDVRASFGTLTCLRANVGGSCTVSATLRFAGSTTQVPGTVGVTTIESSDPSIARVGTITYTQGTGVTTSATITGVAPGTVTITASYLGMNGVVRTESYSFTVSP